MLFARRTTIFALLVSVSLCNVTLKFLPSRSPFESDLASWLTKDSQCSVTLVMSNSLQPTRLLCPWNFPGKNTGVGCHFLLQGIFPTQRLNPRLLHRLHWQAGSLPLCYLGIPFSPTSYTFIHIFLHNRLMIPT